TLAGLAILVPEQWKFLLLSAIFGVGFVLAGRLDYLRLRNSEKRGHVVVQEAILICVLAGAYLVVVTLPFNPILRLLWILTITFLASYRSFRINGSSIAPSRAFIFAIFVAQVVTFLAWAVTALEGFLILNEGTFAVILLFAWYINRGLVRHTVEESFMRHVVLEYVAFAAVNVYLFVSGYEPGPWLGLEILVRPLPTSPQAGRRRRAGVTGSSPPDLPASGEETWIRSYWFVPSRPPRKRGGDVDPELLVPPLPTSPQAGRRRGSGVTGSSPPDLPASGEETSRYMPRKAFWTSAELSRSLPEPDCTMLPVSST